MEVAMKLTGKKVFILVETIYNDLEFWLGRKSDYLSPHLAGGEPRAEAVQ